MTRSRSTLSSKSIRNTALRFQLLGVLGALLFVCVGANAQTATDGMTPSGLSPGAAAGAYGLSGFDNINLYNGNLNFSMPLLGIGGRGGAQTQMRLTLDSVHWVLEDGNSWNPNWWEGIRPGYGPGVLQARTAMTLLMMPHEHPGATLTRLTFTAPDGTEYQLVDTYHGGQQYIGGCSANTRSRGQVFVSHADAGFITFVSSATIYDQCAILTYSNGISGYLYFPDGARYEISNGLITKTRDRNGNLLSFTYDVNKRVTNITDSLNRQVTVSYADMSSVFYDQISYKGFGGASRTLKVWHTSLSNALRSAYSVQTYGQLFFGGSDSTVYNPSNVVSAVELPDGRQYQFLYNPYGELARMVLPTSGAIEYDYVEMGSATAYSAPVTQRRVSERRVYADGTNLESKQVYTATYNGTTTTSVENRDASNNLLAKSQHYFYSDPISSISTGYFSSFAYSNWQEGCEFKTESLAADGTTVLRRVEETWEQGTTVTSWLASENAANNPRVNQTVSTLVDTNQVSKETFSHDSYNNTTDTYEYDYGSGSAGSLVRHTQTSFMTTNSVNSTDYTSSSNSLYFFRLPAQTSVYDASSVERARTSFEYDNYSSTSPHAALTNRSSISGLDSGFTTSYGTRANVTATTHYLLDSSGSVTGSITTYAQYDIAGNVTAAIDGRGNTTSFGYADCFGAPNGDATTNSAPNELSTPGQSSFAMLTSATNALSQTAYAQYDYYLGKAVDGQDINGVVATGYYDDALDRPTKVIRDYNNLAAKSQILFSYDDTNHSVTTKSDFATLNDQLLRKDALYDGLGRATETHAYENSTQYIAVKQVPFVVLQDPDSGAWVAASQSSNPYRSYLNESPVWTTAFTDALGRTTKVRTPDSAIARTSYSGNTVTVTDQAGKSRKSVTDALGRLTTIYEDPSSLNYSTSYTYDLLNNLTQVSQGSQTRTFVYDSLKRLTSATNPESGTISYQYDANANLTQKTDALSVTTTYAYDAINRVTSHSYSDSTPTVSYYYDSQTLPSGAPSFTRGYSTGRLVACIYGSGSAGTYDGYDALGRIVRQYQQTDSVNYLMEATYNLANGLASETYPSVPGASDRRTVSFAYDGAGRSSSLSSSATSYGPAASVSSISYAAHNGLTSETYGNNLIHAVSYNNRLQPNEIKLGTSSNSTSVLDLTYSYGTTSNNGNVLSVSYSGGGLSYTQNFGYDALNRLTTATETTGSTTNWSQTNGYDQYGNRWIDYGGGSPNLGFSTSTNRITTGGFTYDSAGNLTNDTVHSYAFDAENKIKTVDGASAYVYDGHGHRVRKLVGEDLRFVYDMHGQEIAEFDGSSGDLKKEYVFGANGLVATIEPTAVNSNGTRYETSDHLGSPRVVTNSSSTVISRHDYMPFGEELFAGTGGRTTGIGYSVSDGNRKQFTQKERDSETGLDYFLARYYSSTQGRFTSPDPVFVNFERLVDPQRLNLYGYVRNNPLSYIDPNGADIVSIQLVSIAGTPNQLAQNDPRWKSQEAGRVEQLGPVINGGNFVYAVNIVVTVTPDDSPDNYDPVQVSFVIEPVGQNTDPNRPGESGKESPDNPEKKNVTTKGNTLVWFDNPGLETRGIPPAGVNKGYVAVFSSTVKPKKGTNGKQTDIVLYWGLKLDVQNGKIVNAVAVPITQAEYYKLTGKKPPKAPKSTPQPKPTPKRS